MVASRESARTAVAVAALQARSSRELSVHGEQIGLSPAHDGGAGAPGGGSGWLVFQRLGLSRIWERFLHVSCSSHMNDEVFVCVAFGIKYKVRKIYRKPYFNPYNVNVIKLPGRGTPHGSSPRTPLFFFCVCSCFHPARFVVVFIPPDDMRTRNQCPTRDFSPS